MLERLILGLYFLFAAFSIFGEIALNAYENEHGAKNKIYALQQAEIDSLMKCDEIKEARQAMEKKISPWLKTVNAYAAQNERAIAEKRYDANLYDRKIALTNAKIDSTRGNYTTWLNERLAQINAKYDDKLESIAGVKGFGNGLTIVAILPLLAFFLPVLSSAVIAKIEFGGMIFKLRWLFMGAAFFAQYASCQVMRGGLILKLGSTELADLTAYSIFVGIPMVHYAGMEYLRDIRLHKKAADNGGVVKHAEMSQDDIMRIVPNDKWEAAAWLYKEKQAGNGHGYQAIVAKKFDVSNEAVRQWVLKYAEKHPA